MAGEGWGRRAGRAPAASHAARPHAMLALQPTPRCCAPLPAAAPIPSPSPPLPNAHKRHMHLHRPRQAAVRNGHIKRLTDPDIQSSVLEIMSSNVATTYISTPADPEETLGIKLPFLVMIIKVWGGEGGAGRGGGWV